MLNLICCPLNSIGELPSGFSRWWNRFQAVQPFEGVRCVHSLLSWCQTLLVAWMFILSRKHFFSFPLWYSVFPALLLLHWWKHAQFLQFQTPTEQNLSHLRRRVFLPYRNVLKTGLLLFLLHREALFVSLPSCMWIQLYRIRTLRAEKCFGRFFWMCSSHLIVNDNKTISKLMTGSCQSMYFSGRTKKPRTFKKKSDF